MKKIIILITLLIPCLTFSQTATKSQENRSNMITSYVIEKLELNKENAVERTRKGNEKAY